MRAIDVNIVVRPILRDDPHQVELARHILGELCLLLPTVMLETIWVLEKYSRLDRSAIVDAMSAIMALPKLECENEGAIIWALARYAAGADFADMLHLALSGQADAFVTFDRRIARHADASVVRVETLA